MMRFASLALVLGLATAACGDDDDTDSDADTDTDTDTDTFGPFDDMNTTEKQAYMTAVVLPTMKPLYVTYNAEYEDTFNCDTCHTGAPDDFSMPSVFALDFAKFPYSESEDEDEAAAGVFMEQTVLPTMADLLGREIYDPETMEGMSCFACHEMPG